MTLRFVEYIVHLRYGVEQISFCKQISFHIQRYFGLCDLEDKWNFINHEHISRFLKQYLFLYLCFPYVNEKNASEPLNKKIKS